MKRFLLGIVVVLVSSSHRMPVSNSNTILVITALNYVGVPYKYGGISKSGMDCSGLLFKTFDDLNIPFMRSSYEQSVVYPKVSKKNLRPGDLVYFKVGKTSKINHTGIVTKIINKNTITFLHSSTSKGVIEDNLYSNYWKPKFVKATRPKLK